MRHPYAARLEMAVNSRLAVEAAISDGITLGLRAGILDEHNDPVGLSLGFDDLLFPKEGYLFGQEPPAYGLASGRAWSGWRRKSTRASMARGWKCSPPIQLRRPMRCAS